jgi:hypothetical protein
MFATKPNLFSIRTITIPKSTRLKKVIILILSINIRLVEKVPSDVHVEQVFVLTI